MVHVMTDRFTPPNGDQTPIQYVGIEILKAKAKWLAVCMEKMLPPEIFELSKTGQREDLEAVNEYLKKHGIEWIQTPTVCQLVKKKQDGSAPEVLSEFLVRWEGKSFRVLATGLPKPLEPLG